MQDHDTLLLVRNRSGVGTPFSLEVLATSVLVAGVDVGSAYGLARRVVDACAAQGSRTVGSDQLARGVAEALEAAVGPEAAERYRGWRSSRRLGRPLVLCVQGAPGVGKSTFATRLAPRLGFTRVVPTEAVREVLRTVVPKDVLPELHLSAHDAAIDSHDLECSAFLRQARAVTGAAAAVAARSVAEGRSVLLVGAHLVPGGIAAHLRERGCAAQVLEVLLTLDDERLHRARMLRRLRSDPALPGIRHLRAFAGVRQLQQLLRRLAREGGVVAHDAANEDLVLAWIVDHVLAVAAASLEGTS